MTLSVPLSPVGVALSVAIVVPSFDRGGLEQVALNLYRGYRRRGCKCVVLVERNVAGYMLGLLEDPAHGIVFDGQEAVFLEALAEHGVDVVHYHYSTFGLPDVRRFGIYAVYTIHNVYTWLDDAAFAHHAGRVLEADRLVAVSTFVRDYFRARSGCPVERVDIVENGIDLDWILERGMLVERPPGEPFRFAMPASFFPVKHHALVIRAAERLAAERDDFEVVLVGNVGEEDCAARVEALIAASPAGGRVRTLPYMPRDEMAEFYRAGVDAVLLPTLQEGCSNVVLEALALDKPMVLTDVGNAREAARLSPRVRVIPSAEEVARLTPARIGELSLSGDTGNLDALVAAMHETIDAPVAPAAPDVLAKRRSLLGVDRMTDAYYRGFAAYAPLAAVSAPPAWESVSNTADTAA